MKLSRNENLYEHRSNMRIPILAVIFTATVALVAGTPCVWSEQPKTITNSIGMELTLIPSGSFIMGSPRGEAERDDKEERHDVSITKPFYLGEHEVTQAQYSEVMGDNKSTFKEKDNPVENVEWIKAKLFCERLSARAAEKKAGRTYRLPTEAEWEYACRAGATTAFHFGDSLSSAQANFNGNYPAGSGSKGNYLRKPTKVGSYEPNALGLYDMHGNVAEWCADWYDPDYYLDSPDEDPLGPPLGVVPTNFTNNGKQNFFVAVRGGCWVDDGRACRSAYRFRAMPNTRYQLIGFRVVCEVK
jgi:formylglycine-generating enzyme required for sulfatase activity